MPRYLLIIGDDEFAYSLIDATFVFMINHKRFSYKEWSEIYGLLCVHEMNCKNLNFSIIMKVSFLVVFFSSFMFLECYHIKK